MPAQNLEDVLDKKPVTFSIKTGGGEWKCQLHSNRAAYERSKAAQSTTSTTTDTTEAVPGISRTDTGLSSSSASTSSSN